MSGLNLTEGLRAAVASGAVLFLGVCLHSFPLMIAAFAANLACFCDVGGPLRVRIKALCGFTVLGAFCWVGFGLLRNLDWPFVVPLASAAVFFCSMARVWGFAAQTVGNVLIVTLALALDAPLGGRDAAIIGVSFVAGGAWAVLLTAVIWQIRPARPAMRAVEQVWLNLAALTRDLRQVVSGPPDAGLWDAHARAHRRATRVAIEDARLVVADALRARGPLSVTVRQVELRLETAETIFAALIALSDVLESRSVTMRLKSARALRLLRPLLVLCGRGRFADLARLRISVAKIAKTVAADAAIASLFATVGDGLEIATRLTLPDTEGLPVLSALRPHFTLRHSLAPLHDNLTWDSAIMRHALRATVVTAPAIAWSLIWWSPYSHWLTITVALTMQPYFAATWQRMLERIGGTMLGGLMGASIAFMPSTPLSKTLLLIPLCVIGFSVRQVSYGAYVACLTPLVVVLFDVAVPGHSDAMIAIMRLTFTVLGGVVAVTACMLLWPSWEPARLAGEIRTALRTHARLAEVLFSADTDVDARTKSNLARRAAGLAANNLEASLSRALQEPHRGRNPDIEAGIVVDAAIRRVGAALISLQHDGKGGGPTDVELHEQWRRWLTAALDDLAEGRRASEPAPPASPESTLARLRRAVSVIETALTHHDDGKPEEAACDTRAASL